MTDRAKIDIFDEAGNLIERPKSDKIDLIPEKTFKCRYCEFEYDSKSARAGHERWCDDNPNIRKTNSLESKTNLEPNKIDLIPEKETFCCQFCEQEWDNEISKLRHENWCKKNPNHRLYKKVETKIKPETKKLKENSIIEELREFDRLFGLTDEQIVKYIKRKMEK